MINKNIQKLKNLTENKKIIIEKVEIEPVKIELDKNIPVFIEGVFQEEPVLKHVLQIADNEQFNKIMHLMNVYYNIASPKNKFNNLRSCSATNAFTSAKQTSAVDSI